MKSLYWITGVAIIAGGAFFLTDMHGSMWTSLVWGMSVVGLYFIGLLVYIIRQSRSTGDVLLGIGILMFLAGTALYSGFANYQHAEWHNKILTEQIRSTLDKGIMTSYLNRPLLKTLYARYQGQSETENLTRLFLRRYGDQLKTEENLTRFVPRQQSGEHFKDPPFMYYDSTRTDSKVVLIGNSKFGNGEDSAFTNYDGSKGNLQYKAVLTAKGVDYVKEN